MKKGIDNFSDSNLKGWKEPADEIEGYEEEWTSTLEFLSQYIRFEPRDAEADIIDKLNLHIDKLMENEFGNIDGQIRKFHDSFNKGEVNARSAESLILEIQKVVYLTSSLVSQLYNDAYLAEKIQEDEYWEAYRQPTNVKTKDDRQAHAYQQTRDSRFYYYYRFLLWRRLSEKLNALKELQKTIEFHVTRVGKKYTYD